MCSSARLFCKRLLGEVYFSQSFKLTHYSGHVPLIGIGNNNVIRFLCWLTYNKMCDLLRAACNVLRLLVLFRGILSAETKIDYLTLVRLLLCVHSKAHLIDLRQQNVTPDVKQSNTSRYFLFPLKPKHCSS